MNNVTEAQILNNDELVMIWGTESNKNNYKKNKKVTGSMKKSLLDRARMECEIEDLGRGKYKIIKIREVPIPKTMVDIENTIYECLCPLILYNSISSYHNKENKLEISLIKYYNLLQNISNNYNKIRYGSKDSCEKLDIDIQNHKDFFKESSSFLKRTLENSLNYLEKMKTTKCYKFRMIVIRESTLDSDSEKINVDANYIHRRATDEEIRYELDVKDRIMKELNIEEEKDCYFSFKSKEFSRLIKEEYAKKDIKFFYDGYEIYYTSIEKCINILNLFKNNNPNELTKIFNDYVINSIKTNAENRHLKYQTSKVRSGINLDTYLNDYDKLLSNAISIESDNLVIKKDLDINYKYSNGKLKVEIID